MTALLATRRIGAIALVASLVMVIGATVLAGSARAEAPASWRPFLMPSAGAVRPEPPPATGTDHDRRDLDEIVAAQAGGRTSAERIAYWTATPSVTRWNEILLGVVRLDKTNPVRTSRAIALLNTAMYDAIIAACDAKIAYRRGNPAERDSRIRVLAPVDDLSAFASVDVAVAEAARAVLTQIYPGRGDEFEAFADEVTGVRLAAGTSTRTDIEAGAAIGRAVGALAVERATTDGSSAIPRLNPPVFDGVWKAARPFQNDIPLEPMAGTWKPWLMASGDQFRPGPPPVFRSAQWQAEADEVVRVNANLTDDQVRIARFWADGPGTDTPPGHWLRIAIEMIRRDGVSLADAARVLAHVGTAQADSFIACWDSKFHYWTARPIGVIGNFASTVVTPNFPAYVSGHSTVSGASSVVLGQFFPGDAGRLGAMAEEAAMSRLYGGIHWRSDNEVGLVVGRQVGELAAERARSADAWH
ncbi:MAG: phosphatase PAP2 family protein [Chloroflexi bacterium]|nr:phosphatase PAP2 family protein [Chloroflexota bacterium]